jgi:hypothetical protein
VPFDRATADEQPGADLRVGVPVAGKPGDLRFLAVSSSRAVTVRLRAVSPVAWSSRRARSANPSAVIATSMS